MADELDMNMEQPSAQPNFQQTAEPIAQPTSSFADKSLSDLARGRVMLEERIRRLTELSAQRKNQKFDPVMLRMAQGFLAPTKSGGFGESLGNVAGGVAEEQAKQQTLNQQDLENQFSLAKQQYELNKEFDTQKRQEDTRGLMGKLYKKTTDASGNDTYAFDQDVAAQLSQTTGDPKYIQSIIADQKTKQLKAVGQKMFEPTVTKDANGNEKTTYNFNPTAVYDLAKLSDNPLEDIAKYADMVPKLRKAGLLGGVSDASSPFDAIALMAKGDKSMAAIGSQAEYLAKQYAKGLIDDEKANALAQQMLTMSTAHMDRAQAQQFQQSMQGIMLGLRQDNAQWQRDQREKETNLKQQEIDKKLTDEQKITYTKVVVPIINEGTKSATALATVDQMEKSIENAPSGFIAGYFDKSIGKWIGTDGNTALRDLDRYSKSLITQIPRLPGAASNLDATNLEKSIGNLSDPTLTNSQRKQFIKEIKEGFTKLQDRAIEVQDYWDNNRKLPPSALETPQSKDKKLTTGTKHFLNKREIIPNSNNTGWVYKDDGKEAK
jgi:hypothetical protein